MNEKEIDLRLKNVDDSPQNWPASVGAGAGDLLKQFGGNGRARCGVMMVRCSAVSVAARITSGQR